MASTRDDISIPMTEKEENYRVLAIAKNIQKEMDDEQGKDGCFDRGSEKSDHEYVFCQVPNSVRKGGHDYEPKVISIGPIHRNKKALRPMESLKRKYLSELIGRNPEKNTLENYVKAVCSVAEEARKLYSESVILDNNLLEMTVLDKFVEMMVVDGCFLIEFLFKACCGENQQRYLNELNLRRSLPLLRRDLLLLENQIPFIILEVLFNSSDHIPDLELRILGPSDTLKHLIFFYVTLDRFNSLNKLCYWQWVSDSHFCRDRAIPKHVVHLLHVHHACLRSLHSRKSLRRIGSLVAAPFLLLLSCLLTCKTPPNYLGCRRAYPRERGPSALVGVIPSAAQLQYSGVNFKKKKKNDLTVGATFHKEEGVLEISMFSFQDTQISIFHNLIAFEQMYPTAGNHITSHALLMACLVRTKEDVAILRDSGIIESKLNNDIHVVEVFARFLKGSYKDFERLDNRKLFVEVLEYCSAVHHWRVDFKRKYFGNPWTFASLIAAIVALLLTFAQTFYTIYAYHHPPST
ncbi:UPF0481 protein [Iris pallida]|uniref:UPF0481 protein n=1 Tax=Iris pallida TaxID=29817 RepID=A0AAX6EUB2_IRIPA|nr:UPF0481 protein [Iris pallida]